MSTQMRDGGTDRDVPEPVVAAPTHRAAARRRLLVLLPILAALAVGWVLRPRPRPLIDRAVDIGIAPAWHFSAVSACAVQGTRDGAIIGIRDMDLVRYDVRAGTASRLPGVTNRMARRTECIALSPDGSKVLWAVHGRVHATTLDGSTDMVWATGALQVSEVGWQVDSRGWFALAHAPASQPGGVPAARLVVCPSTWPRTLRSIPLSGASLGHSLSGALKDGRILLCSDPSPSRSRADLLVADPAAPAASAVRPLACPAPESAGPGRAATVVASPPGDRLLWVVETPDRPAGLMAWARRLLRLSSGGSARLSRLYCTRLDGSRPALIMEASQDEQGLVPLGWAADGRHLLMARRSRVLLVPTE